MIKLLTEEGINSFIDELEIFRDGGNTQFSAEFINSVTNENDNKYSILLDKKLSLKKNFTNKYEFATYIHDIVQNYDFNVPNIWMETGFWSWLSVYYFDLMCPLKNGVRKPNENWQYILEIDGSATRFSMHYRHLIAGPVRLYDFHGDNAKIFLSNKLDAHGDYAEQFGMQKELVHNKTIIAVLNDLYCDQTNVTMKRGGQSKGKPGTHRRYKSVLSQLSVNYHLQSSTLDELKNLLPSEFDKWLNREPSIAIKSKKGILKRFFGGN